VSLTAQLRVARGEFALDLALSIEAGMWVALPNAVTKRQDPLKSDASVDAQMGIAWSAVSESKPLSTCGTRRRSHSLERG